MMKNKKKLLGPAAAIAFLAVSLVSLMFMLSFDSEEPQKFKWEKTFEDNFDTFNRDVWLTSFEWGNRTIWSNKEIQWYKDENVECRDGVLRIITKKETIYGKDSESEKEFEFTSGMINTPKSFLQAFGKWEMKVRFPYRKGFWPAFWLLPKQSPGLPEIDIFEYFGVNKNQITSNHHWGVTFPGFTKVYEGVGEPFYYVESKVIEGDFADRWMLWEFECFPNKMYWKLDGRVVLESDKGIPTAPMYMLANVAVKKWEANNNEVDNSPEPYVMEIDYIRVYKMIPE